jgi:universal stress protein A
MSFTHILAPTDFSAPAQGALDVALREAELHQASLKLVHVLQHHPHTEVTYLRGNPEDRRGLATEFGSLPTSGEPDAAILRRDFVEEALTKLRDLVPHSFSGHSTVEVASGDAAEAIVQVAREHGIDLIVMSTHGRTGLAHVFLGSVAEKVVRHAPCPVLVTRVQPVQS